MKSINQIHPSLAGSVKKLGIGALFLASAAHNAIKLPLSMYFSNTIKRCVDTLDTVSEKMYGYVFHDTLVKPYKELKKNQMIYCKKN